jgi:hypothetical protein
MLLFPTFEIEIGETVLNTENSSKQLQLIKIEREIDVPIDNLKLTFTNNGLNKIKNGDMISVSLGYDNDLFQVFKGYIDTIIFEIDHVFISALTSMIKLCQKKIDKIYQKQTTGLIVKDLISESNIAIKEDFDGIQLEYFYIDSNKSIYEHIQYLTKISGFNVFMNNNDEITIKKFQNTKEDHIIEYGKDILSIEQFFVFPNITKVKVVGESPSMSKGKKTSHWLTKESIESEVEQKSKNKSTSKKNLIIIEKNIKDSNVAETVAKSLLSDFSLSKSINVKTLGKEKLLLGDIVSIVNMPNEVYNGKYHIDKIHHSLDKQQGFITQISCKSEPK